MVVSWPHRDHRAWIALGAKPIELAKGKSSMECSSMEELIATCKSNLTTYSRANPNLAQLENAGIVTWCEYPLRPQMI